MNASRSTRKARFAAGALWIGGADNYVIEILGNGHKPGLKAVRVYEPNGHSSHECQFVGNQIARRHAWAGPYQDELRAVIRSGSKIPTRVAEILRKVEANEHEDL